MRIFNDFLACLLVIVFVPAISMGQKGVEGVQVAYVDPLEKVLKEQTYFPDQKAQAHVARGEVASFQFVFRNAAATTGLSTVVAPIALGGNTRVEAVVSYVGYVKNGRNTPSPSRDRISSASGWYPDPLLALPSKDIPAFDNQPVWISVPIPLGAVPGTYQASVVFTGKSGGKVFRIEKTIEIKVYPARISGQSLWVTNWWFANPDQLRQMNRGQEVPRYSDRYWEIIRVFARNMKAYRQNIAMISPLELTSFAKKEGVYTFDFSNFDKTVGIFREEGGIQRVEGGHLGARLEGWDSPFGLSVPVWSGEAYKLELLPLEDSRTRDFYKQFIPAFMAHLKERNWKDGYIQHIADEPIQSNIESYRQISAFLYPLLEGTPVIEANHASSLDGSIDVWVPQLNFLRDDFAFYQEQQRKGKEVWFYTCLAPQGNFANRFVELPLLQTRLLHWINYRFGITGYLHWGYNCWGCSPWNKDPYGDVSGIIEVSCNVLPGGDTHIVYPDYMRLNSSIRLEAMRDGICDYELLQMLGKKDPDFAKTLAGTVVAGFELYDGNVEAFRSRRIKMLEKLSD